MEKGKKIKLLVVWVIIVLLAVLLSLIIYNTSSYARINKIEEISKANELDYKESSKIKKYTKKLLDKNEHKYLQEIIKIIDNTYNDDVKLILLKEINDYNCTLCEDQYRVIMKCIYSSNDEIIDLAVNILKGNDKNINNKLFCSVTNDLASDNYNYYIKRFKINCNKDIGSLDNLYDLFSEKNLVYAYLSEDISLKQFNEGINYKDKYKIESEIISILENKELKKEYYLESFDKIENSAINLSNNAKNKISHIKNCVNDI